jgi:hypothetical protein
MADQQNAQGALLLVADLRFALGDNGLRMQPELIEYAKELHKDALRYRKWRADYTAPDADAEPTPMMVALCDAWTPEAVDAIIDAALEAATTQP